MPRTVYLDEAAYLASVVPRDRCPSTDALDVLDVNPHLRLALEDSWTDCGGRVYREVPAETVSRWPAYISRSFRSFLVISRDPAQVIELFDLLKELDAGVELVQMTLAGCRRRKELGAAITYYRQLAEELRAVTYEPDPEVEQTLSTEPRNQPRVEDGQVTVGPWIPAHEDEDPKVSPTHRAVLLHDPSASSNDPPDWIERQPRRFRRLYYWIKRGKPSDLARMKAALVETETATFTRSQWKVLWDGYRIRRDYLRRQEERTAATRLGRTAKKLVHRIRRISSKPELGYVGKRLYESMRGEIRLPGPVSQPEWGVIFELYRQRKDHLCNHQEQSV